MVAELKAGTGPVSFGVSKAPVGLSAEQGPLLRAKDAHEKHDNLCPGEIVILTSSDFAQGQLFFFF